MEQDTQEACLHRRELVKLLVEKITVDRDEDGRAEVHITYRFGPPPKGQLVLWMVYGIPGCAVGRNRTLDVAYQGLCFC